jgi:hypothetical protein
MQEGSSPVINLINLKKIDSGISAKNNPFKGSSSSASP